MTARVQVYDPAMCCSTGVCGPAIDPDLIRFARDLAWLRHHDITVDRYNLAQEPGAFVDNATILAALQTKGPECLPIVLVDGEPVVVVGYPTREYLMGLLNLEVGA